MMRSPELIPSFRARGLILSGLLVTVSLASPIATSPHSAPVQGKPSEWKQLQSPEEVPDYLAWRYFLRSVDRNYRLGKRFYYGFINLQLEISPLFEGDRETGERVIQALADRATLAMREEERFRSEGQYRRRFLEMGAMSPDEVIERDREAFREQIRAMEKACHALQREILSLAPQTGEAIWRRIDQYVQTTIKSSTSVMVETESNGGGYKTMLEFQAPPREIHDSNAP